MKKAFLMALAIPTMLYANASQAHCYFYGDQGLLVSMWNGQNISNVGSAANDKIRHVALTKDAAKAILFENANYGGWRLAVVHPSYYPDNYQYTLSGKYDKNASSLKCR